MKPNFILVQVIFISILTKKQSYIGQDLRKKDV
jgi:hypothetical protein